ncbi:MAG: putative membrane protein, partial [Candidatus Azotimanducaceae bacterium]
MDFFESQSLARRKTRLLLFLFILAVLSLVLLTNLLVYVFINFQDTASVITGRSYYTWETFAGISFAVVVLVFFASMFRLLALRKGGSAIAELMDGELIVSANGDLNRQKLLNVVEEMAIASGTP